MYKITCFDIFLYHTLVLFLFSCNNAKMLVVANCRESTVCSFCLLYRIQMSLFCFGFFKENYKTLLKEPNITERTLWGRKFSPLLHASISFSPFRKKDTPFTSCKLNHSQIDFSHYLYNISYLLWLFLCRYSSVFSILHNINSPFLV